MAGILIGVVNTVSLTIVKPYSLSSTVVCFFLLILFLVYPGSIETYPLLYSMTHGTSFTILLIAAIMGVGTIIGSFIAAKTTGNFVMRRPVRDQAIRSFVGGMLMSLGLFLAEACNIGNILTKLPLLVPFSIFATCGIAVGAYIGVRFMLWLSRRRVMR